MRYRRRPYEVEAFQWTGGPDQAEEPEWFAHALATGMVHAALGHMYVKTLRGIQRARPGDYIVMDAYGYLDVYLRETFEKLFEPTGE